jgi:Fe-S-cluster containining protein
MTSPMAGARDWDAQIARLPTTRTCDGCDLCCTAVGVEDGAVQKNPGVRCSFLKGDAGHNCTIYDRRPDTCGAFVCLWRGSDTCLPPSMFPADCGFVMAIASYRARPLVLTVHPDPDRPDHWKVEVYLAEFRRLARELNAIVVVGEGKWWTHFVTPKGNLFAREDSPLMFPGDGRQVAAPAYEFLPFHPNYHTVVTTIHGAMEVRDGVLQAVKGPKA